MPEVGELLGSEFPFDRPFGRLRVLSIVEGLRAPSFVEGLVPSSWLRTGLGAVL
jgi:hypothetical protein